MYVRPKLTFVSFDFCFFIAPFPNFLKKMLQHGEIEDIFLNRHDGDSGRKSVGEAETDELRDVLSPAAKLWRRQGPSLWKAAQPT